MLSSFQHPRRSIFLSLEHVTLSSPFLHSCPLTRICTDVHARLHTPTRKHGTSMAQSPDGPLWDKNTRCFSKASFIHSKQKGGFTSALFPPLGPGLGLFFFLPPPLSLLLTPWLGSFNTGQWGSEVRSLCSHVSMLVHSVRLALFTIDAQRDWPAAFDAGHPHSDMNEHGCRGTPAPLCVCRFTVNARGVCLFWMTWKFGIKPEICCESGQNRIFCLCVTALNFSRYGRCRFNFFLNPCVSQYFDITSKLYVPLFNIWAQHSINMI